ncbi:MAG: NAD(P)/FAD-dependent oxidoreductase [Spirochaetia bacterium]|nr:NAD(P)/FAD-dependent oxidoreductase [Spirochaetia bacterium]
MYDLVVIGSGPAGHTAALSAVKHRLKVALIERRPEMMGGVCLNEGCIPLKGLLYYSIHEKDYNDIRGNVMQRVEHLRMGLYSRLTAAGVEIIQAEARLTPDGMVMAGEKRLEAKNILIAVGSSPRKFFNNPAVFTPEKIFEMEEAPKKALIIGGGVIGCEYASFLANIGTDVEIVELMDTILFGEDEESVRTLSREFKKRGIKLYEKCEVAGISTERFVEIKQGDSITTRRYDMIFEAIGRRPNTGRLGLEEAGVKLNDKGFIEVNENMQTSVGHIYAAGDCVPSPMLAYTATKEAETAVTHMTERIKGHIDYDSAPKLVFSTPQMGSVGLSEKKAKEREIDYRVYKYYFKAIGKAVVEGRDAGFIKILADRGTDLIIGAAAVGDEITDIMNELTIIIRNSMTTDMVVECMHIHPSYSEIITEALTYGG